MRHRRCTRCDWGWRQPARECCQGGMLHGTRGECSTAALCDTCAPASGSKSAWGFLQTGRDFVRTTGVLVLNRGLDCCRWGVQCCWTCLICGEYQTDLLERFAGDLDINVCTVAYCALCHHIWSLCVQHPSSDKRFTRISHSAIQFQRV